MMFCSISIWSFRAESEKCLLGFCSYTIELLCFFWFVGLMEALLTSRVVPVQVPCRKLSSLSDDFSCLELRRYKPCRRGSVSIMSHSRLVRPVTASVQPQRVSALGHEGNTVPSKGYYLLLYVVFEFRE